MNKLLKKLNLLLFSLFSIGAIGQDVQLPKYEVVEVGIRAGEEKRDWGHQYLLDDMRYYELSQGENVILFILDTGGSPNHPDLKGNVIIPLCRDFSGSNDWKDYHGHGTHCAGIATATGFNNLGIIGIAPKTKVVFVKVLDDKGSGYLSKISQGIRYCADVTLPVEYRNAKRVLSMSFGGTMGNEDLQSAVDYAISKGCFLFAAAGNSGCERSETIDVPGNYPNVITVFSIGKTEKPSYFSSCGKNGDLSAPGESVYSTYLNDGYAVFNGTSQATPHAAGIGCLILSKYPNIKTQAELEAYMRIHARYIGPAGYQFDTRTGYGVPIANNYLLEPGDDEQDEPVEPEPPTETPPLRTDNRVVEPILDHTYSIWWKAADEGKFRTMNISMQPVLNSKYHASVVWDSLSLLTEQYFSKRYFILKSQDDDVEMLKWARHFVEMYYESIKLDVSVKSLKGSDENGRSWQLTDLTKRNTKIKNRLIKKGKVRILRRM